MKKIIVLLMCGFMFLSGCQKGGDGPGTASLKISVEPPATGKVQKNAKVTLPAVIDSLSIVVRDTNNAVVASGSLGGGSYDVILVVPSGVALTVTAEAYNGANLLYSGSNSITLQEGALASLNINMNYVGSTYTLGGTLSGLVGSVVLQNNGGDDLTLTTDGAFTFSTQVIFGAAYNITVLTQPTGQTCSIANATGSATANVTGINVTCAASTATISGTVSGLSGAVVLQNNGGDDLNISTNGVFTFSTPIATGSAYVVTVLTQPAGQTCIVSNGVGTAATNISNVSVTCSTASQSTYLYYKDAAIYPSVASNLTTIDPAVPAVTTDVTGSVLLEPTGAGQKQLIADVTAGTYDNANGIMTNVHRYAIVYVSGGRIYKRSALVGGGAAVQLSNVTNITDSPGNGTGTPSATDLCVMGVIDNFAAPDNSVIYYGLSGVDQLCGTADDAYFSLTLTTSSTAPPTTVADPLPFQGITLYDPNSAALDYIGSLVINGSSALVRYDAGFANPVVVDNGPFTLLTSLNDMLQNGTLLLQVDNTLRVFDPASNTLGAPLHTLAASSSIEGVFDEAGFYFVDSSLGYATSNVLWRIPLPNVTAAEVVVTETHNIGFVDAVTANFVVYDVDTIGIRSVDRFANDLTSSLALVNETPGGGVFGSVTGDTASMYTQIAAGNKIYVNEYVIGSLGSIYRSHMVNDDGTGLVTLDDGNWQGFSYGPDLSVYKFLENVDMVILLQRMAGSDVDSNATLHTYDAVTGTDMAMMPGVVPSDIEYLDFMFGEYRSDLLVKGYAADAVPVDVLYYNLSATGSMVRITSDGATTDETPVYFGD